MGSNKIIKVSLVKGSANNNTSVATACTSQGYKSGHWLGFSQGNEHSRRWENGVENKYSI